MSFRNRLVLFFVVIVIVPMLAVTFLLFGLIERSQTGQAESAVAERHRLAYSVFLEQRTLAADEAEDVGTDPEFAGFLRDGDLDRARRRAEQLLERRAIERIVFVRDGEAVVRAGNRRAIAPAVLPVISQSRRRLGTLGVSVQDAGAYAQRVRKLTGSHVVVLNGEKVLATTSRALDPETLPSGRGAELKLGGDEYRVQNFRDRGAFAGQQIRVFTLGVPPERSTAGARLVAAAILLGFFLIAIVCAVLVSRTLQQQIAAFLTAARRLASGDFSAKVPTVGHDEFAELGEEFNKMSRELERRLAELTQERGRVQQSMRRFGEAVGANLDRDELLRLVVQSAVDGVGADAGRASVSRNGSEMLEERSRVGSVNGLESALAAVEADALQSDSLRETTIGAAHAIAHPLRATAGRDALAGVVSVGRSGRAFSASDREFFTYLAGRAARSMENVDLHETVARGAVTDPLTGLSNRRAFDAALASEVERAKRIPGAEFGLVLIDIDDFGQFNKIYGVLDGDAVLREVARVLRDTSREIDHAARYGGEELTVILPGTDLEGAYNRAERIREQIEQLRIPRVDGGGTLRVTASCGVASARGAAADEVALVDAASKALIEAKRSGKNRSVQAR